MHPTFPINLNELMLGVVVTADLLQYIVFIITSNLIENKNNSPIKHHLKFCQSGLILFRKY